MSGRLARIFSSPSAKDAQESLATANICGHLHLNCSSVQLFSRTTAAILSREHRSTPSQTCPIQLRASALQNWLDPQVSNFRRVPFPLRRLCVLCDSALSFALEFVPPLFSWSYKILFPQLTCFHNYLRCYPGVTCRSLYSLPFATAPANPLAPISQLQPLQWLADSLSLLHLSCLSFAQALRLFSIVCRLFLQNTGGGGVPHSQASARLSAFCPPRNLFARCSRTLYPQSRLHLRFP